MSSDGDLTQQLAALTVAGDTALANTTGAASSTSTSISTSTTSISQSVLPVDIVSIALLYIDVYDVPRVARTCKDWTSTLRNVEDELWISVLRKHNRILSHFSDKVLAVIDNSNEGDDDDDGDSDSVEPFAPSSEWKKLFRRAFLVMRMGSERMGSESNLRLDALSRAVLEDPPTTTIIMDPRYKSSYDFSINIRVMGDNPDVPPNGNLLPINRSGSQIDAETGVLVLDLDVIDVFPPHQNIQKGFVWVTLRNRDSREEVVVFRGSYKSPEDVEFKPYRWKDKVIEVDGKRVKVITNASLKRRVNTAKVDLELRFDVECEGERFENLSELELLRLMETVLFGGPRVYKRFDREEREPPRPRRRMFRPPDPPPPDPPPPPPPAPSNIAITEHQFAPPPPMSFLAGGGGGGGGGGGFISAREALAEQRLHRAQMQLLHEESANVANQMQQLMNAQAALNGIDGNSDEDLPPPLRRRRSATGSSSNDEE